MPKVTPAEAAAYWRDNLKARTSRIRTSVQRLTENPMEKAASKKDKMKAKLIEALDQGKWEAGLRRRTLEQWKERFLTKGIANISTGADAAVRDMEEFFAELFPYQENLLSKIKSMPDLTLQDSINRVTTWIEGMAKFSRK